MSEMIIAQKSGQRKFRWRLLITVSAATLLAVACAANDAKAADSEPPFWIELGGQFAQQVTDQDAFLPPFMLVTPRPPFDIISPTQIEKGSPSSWDGTVNLTFEPAGTDLVFSAGILYGRSDHNKSVDQRTRHVSVQTSFTRYGRPHGSGTLYNAYQHILARNSESHVILDFRVGKDVGLGMFGHGENSIVSLGVRYAQFNSMSSVKGISQPTNKNTYYLIHRARATFDAKRKFIGIGPSLSWDASASLIGNRSTGSIAFDWSLNGAALFGRHRMEAHHQTTMSAYRLYENGAPQLHTQVYQHSASPSRSKQVVVPNVGGFAGFSWRYPNAKVTLGYRADFFFGAMDGGIDAAHKENVGFYGPFASVSIGFGG